MFVSGFTQKEHINVFKVYSMYHTVIKVTSRLVVLKIFNMLIVMYCYEVDTLLPCLFHIFACNLYV